MASWWHAPVCVTVAVVLAFIAISSATHSRSTDRTRSMEPVNHLLSFNTSKALRRSGFSIFATFLLISPEIFFSVSSNITIFAIHDSSLVDTSLPPWQLKRLLQYHTSPLKLSMDDLVKKRQGTCFPSVLPRKNLAVSKIDADRRLVEVNHVWISHPDLFLSDKIAVHGVLGSFSLMSSWDSIQAPICDVNSVLVSNATGSKNMADWFRIIESLSSHGFVSFSIGLHSVLDRILQDYGNLSSVTIFAPKGFAYTLSPSPVLDMEIRYHLLPERVTYKDLTLLPDNASLKTLLLRQTLKVTKGSNFNNGPLVNGVEILEPEVLSTEKVIVHGVSQAFKMALHPTKSRLHATTKS